MNTTKPRALDQLASLGRGKKNHNYRRFPSGRPEFYNSKNAEFRPTLTLIGGLAFACGFAMPHSVKLIGELYLGEVLLVPVALYAFTKLSGSIVDARREQISSVLALACLVSLIGYVISDIAAGTEQDLYLRGWARCIVLLTDVASIATLVRQHRQNLWWLCFGLCVGGLVNLIFIEHVSIDSWKISYSDPVTYLICCFAYRLGQGKTAILLIFAAAIAMSFDSRANPILLLAIAAIIFARRRQPGRELRWIAVVKSMAIPIALVVVGVSIWLANTAEQYGARRQNSSVGRSLGLMIGVKEILKSPVIGHGSWHQNKEADKELQQEMLKEVGEKRRHEVANVSFATHSQFIGSWYEGGILGAVFFIAYFLYLLRFVPRISFKRPLDSFSSLYLYLTLVGMWNLWMSPFGGDHRYRIALACSAVISVAIELNRARRARLAERRVISQT